MMKQTMICLLCLCYLLGACVKGETFQADISPDIINEPESGNYPLVDNSLWPYFRTFELEAENRGLSFDLAALEISGEISDIDVDDVAGQCNYSSHAPNHVILDRQIWNRLSDMYREFLVFHELGHCALLRNHEEGADARGFCISIMRSGTEGCRDSYSQSTRTRLINELFSVIN